MGFVDTVVDTLGWCYVSKERVLHNASSLPPFPNLQAFRALGKCCKPYAMSEIEI